MDKNRQFGWGSLIAALVVGLLAGWFAIGWGLWPVRWTNTDPIDLRQEQREDYLVMVATDYAMTQDASVALNRLQSWPSLAEADREIRELADFYDAQGEGSQSSVLRLLSRGLPLPTGAAESEQPAVMPSEPVGSRLVNWAKIILVVAAVLGLAALAVYVVRQRTGLRRAISDRVRDRPRRARPATEQEVSTELPQVESEFIDLTEPTSKAPPQPATRGGIMPRVFRRSQAKTAAASWTFEAAYMGQGMEYDQTFTLDGKDGEYYGECGVGAATPVGIDFERVNALEVWLFDKSDIRTVAKVLMSDKAFHDVGLREELAGRGDPVLAAPGTEFSLEGNRIMANVVITKVSYLQDEADGNAFSHVAIRLEVGRR
jgi:hypothetical protein